jgi:hypothetical protein
MGRNARYLIIFPAVLFALFAKPAKADVLGNWTYSQSQNCGGSIEVVDNTIILHGPDNGTQEFGMCGGKANWVKIETAIPAGVNTVDFTWAYQTNDGWVYDPPQYGINGVYTLLTQQNNATGELSVPVNEGDIFTFQQYSIDTCCQPGHLTISNLSLWASITSSTTTTTTSTTTVPSTTVPVTNPTTTTVPETSTTVPETTTSVENSTSTTSTTTTTTTSSVPQTTSTESTTTTTEPPAVPTPVTQPQTVEPEPVDTVAPEEPEITETGTTTTLVEETIPEEMLPEETTTTDEPSPEPSPDTTDDPVVDATLPDVDTIPADVDTTLPEATETPLEAPLSDEEVGSLIAEAETTEALVEALADLAPEQVAQVVEALLADEPTQEQATALASSPEVLAVITAEQATQIFEALDVTELDNTQVAELIAAVQYAPTAIRESFEDTIDIFKNALDTYVPVGSNIPVGTRRTLIAVTAGLTLATAGSRIRRK